ncbi:MAG: glycosyltransferase family 4 protein [Rhodospirillales bacterium]
MITLPPDVGGVTTMARAFGRVLQSAGYAVTAAHRATYSDAPKLSVPIWAAPFRRPMMEVFRDDRVGLPRYGVGTWLPELEWTHYLPWQPWHNLIGRFAHHVVVTGNGLSASGLAKLGLPALNWIATSYLADRTDRFRTKPLARRLFDRVLNRPVCERVERFVLEKTHVLALSDYTARELKAVTPAVNLAGVLRMPIELTAARPRPAPRRSPLVIGFAGRLTDPRKNIGLLFDAFRLLRGKIAAELHLVGDLTPEWAQQLGAGDLLDGIRFLPVRPATEMAGFYQGLDIFVIPSRQEGLAIVGLEAMAQGLPVVSTRCGGPEDYVLPNDTGYLTGFDAGEMADAVLAATGDDAQYARLSANALSFVQNHHGFETFKDAVMTHFRTVYLGN